MHLLRRYGDIIVTDALACILAALVFTAGSGIPRIVIGIPGVIFLPGYVLTAALFPRKSNLSPVERIALSIGASTAVVILIGLALNYTPFGITVISTTVTLSTFIIAMSVVAYLRRRGLTEEEMTALRINLDLPHWRQAAAVERILVLALAASVVLALGTSIYVSARPRPGDSFTEFYLLSESRVAEKYTREMTIGKEYVLVLGVINRERQENSYRVVVTLDGTRKENIGPLMLTAAEKREFEYRYRPDTVGDNQKLEFLLYRNDETEPCANLYLRIWVKPY